jgi:hypothetical protein
MSFEAKLAAYRAARSETAMALAERLEARMLQIVEARMTALLDVLAS